MADTPPADTPATVDEANEEEQNECRICRGGEEAGVLFHPCHCTGSIRWIHQEW